MALPVGDTTIGRYVKAWRMLNDVTQKDLAADLNIPASMLSEVENDRREVGQAMAQNLAKAMSLFGQEAQDLISLCEVSRRVLRIDMTYIAIKDRKLLLAVYKMIKEGEISHEEMCGIFEDWSFS